MRAICTNCGYVCYAVDNEDLANMVCADGGLVETIMPGVYDLGCPACDEALEIENPRRH